MKSSGNKQHSRKRVQSNDSEDVILILGEKREKMQITLPNTEKNYSTHRDEKYIQRNK